MEDRVLSSMCDEPTSYCSFSEQREALKQCQGARRTVSSNSNTYIYMVIPILAHWVAVQVTISPFVLEGFPGQTFFSSQLRYGPCCQIHNGDTLDAVINTVQKVIDSFYRPVCWSYSSQCCTLDRSNNNDTKQCIPVIKSRFQAYASSAYTRGGYAIESLAQDRSIVTSTLPHDQQITAESTSSNRSFNIESLLAPANEINTQGQGNATNIICNSVNGTGSLAFRAVPSSSTVCKRKFGNSGLLEESGGGRPVRQRISKEQQDAQDAQLAQNTAAWIKEGLQKLSVQDFPHLVTPSDTVLSQSNDESQAYADYLWRCAEEVENASAAFAWSLRFIAACALLVGAKYASSSETVEPNQASRQSLHRWRGAAEIINCIVNGMLPSWKDRAYLIYHVCAAKGQTLSAVGRLSEARRQTFASAIIDALKPLSAPNRIEGVPFFDPTRALCGLFHQRSYEEICQAIGLPLAPNSRIIENEGSSTLFPSMTNLYFRINDCHLTLTAPPAKLDSGERPTPSVTTHQTLPIHGPISTPMLTSTGVNDADRLNDKGVETGRNTSPNPLTHHVLDMNYPWNTNFNVPSTPALDHTSSWATGTTSDPLEIPGPSMLDFNLDWDNNFALQQHMELEAHPATTGVHTS